MSVVKMASNAVIAKLLSPPKEVITFVNNLLSYQPTGIGFGSSSWNGKSSFFNVLNHTFPAGFAEVVREEIEKQGHKVHHIKKPLLVPAGPESPIVDEFGNDDPRYDYQMKALKQVEKYQNGIIRVATGGGKSKIAKLIMARYKKMTLFVTTRGVLLYQMQAQLDEIGMKSGQIGDGELRAIKGVNLGMVQTLVQALDKPDLNAERRAVVKSMHLNKSKNVNTPEAEIQRLAKERFDKKVKLRDGVIKFLSMVEVVIGEEAHEAGGTSYFEILRHCTNAQVRVALTATPFMRDNPEDNMRLMAAFGRILIDISEEELINRGILAKPYFQFKNVGSTTKLYKSSPFERAYTLGYIDNDVMHTEIVTDAQRAASLKLPVLTLIARKKHGDALLQKFRAAGLRFEFLQGKDDTEERRKTLAKLVSGDLDGIIGTTILDVGVDVPAIGLVQLCGGMKAEVSLRQRVGRGLRSKKGMPNIAFNIDYSSNIPDSLRDHAKQRENIIRGTPGFAEGVVEELPWEIFEQHMKQVS